MAEPTPHTRRTRAAIALVVALALVLAPSAGAAAPGVTGWLSAAPRFPQRALVLFPPPGAPAILSGVHVSENGRPVPGAVTIPAAGAHPGDFGVIVAVQVSSAVTRPTAVAEGGAIATVLARRAAGQQIGVVGFDRRASLLVPPSYDTGRALQEINTIKHSQGGGAAADPGAAIALAVRTLQRSHVALGGIILLSDGSGVIPGASLARAAATAANVPVITVPIADAHSTASGLRAIAALGDSHTPATAPSQAVAAAALAWSTLQRANIVRWRSAQVRAGTVQVTARINGLPGGVTATYIAPAPARAPVRPHPASSRFPSAAQLHAATVGSERLSATPGFATATLATPRATVPAAAAPSQAAAASEGFWASTPGELVMSLAAGLLVGAAIFLLVRKPESQGVRSRVGVFTPQPTEPDGEAAALIAARPVTGMSNLWAEFVRNVDISRNPRTPAALVKRAALLSVVAAVLLYLASGFLLLALLALVGWPFALRAFVNRAAEKQRRIFRDSVPGYLQDLASAMRVGRSFVGALAAVADGADEPARSQFERAITDEQLGLPLEESLEAVAVRMQAPDMDQVALIAALNRRSGSNVAEALDRVAEGARERADMNREVRALTAQAKMSSYVLTALPGFLLVGISLVSPQYARPFFHTTMGFVCLGVGATMVLAGWKVMKKISEVKV
ncbi:MAG TPA: type II secretion system F family protein [Solirubrobacteraceae bacterium]|nr:type II secretion system F family protein [Solirubrobacteraceae bacterium]